MLTNLSLAQEFAWSLATSLMACVTLFHSEGGYAVVPTAEFDGDAAAWFTNTTHGRTDTPHIDPTRHP